MLKKFDVFVKTPTPIANPKVYAISSLTFLTRRIEKYNAQTEKVPTILSYKAILSRT